MKEDKDRSHAKWEEWLELSQYGELSDADHRELDAHLETCDQCRAYRAQLDQFRMVMEQAASARPGESDLSEARRNLWSNVTLGRAENRFTDGWMSRFMHGLQGLTNSVFAQYRTVLAGALLLFIGLAAGYYLAFQGDRMLGFAAPGTDQTDLLNNDDVAISNVRFVDSDVPDGTLGLRFEAVRPVQIMGPVDDPEIQRVLTFAVLNEQNPGVRLRAVNAVSASERLHSDHEIRDALVTVLKPTRTPASAARRSTRFPGIPSTRKSGTP